MIEKEGEGNKEEEKREKTIKKVIMMRIEKIKDQKMKINKNDMKMGGKRKNTIRYAHQSSS